MSVRVMDAAFRSTVQGLAKRFVLVALADRADDEGYCYPGVAHLARKTGAGVSTVREKLAELEADGLLMRTARFEVTGDGHERQATNDYQINVPMLEDLRAAEPPRSVISRRRRSGS